MYKFFAFLTRMKYIKRWSLMRSNIDENIMEHTMEVVMVAHALALIKNKIYGGNVDEKKVVLLAEYHEVGEVITGDLPTPIKYFNANIKTAYKDLEKEACKKLILMLPKELQESYEEYILPKDANYEGQIVKVADKISALIKCKKELTSGNLEFKKAAESIQEIIEKEYYTEEVQYFMENILPSYSLTLDELD